MNLRAARPNAGTLHPALLRLAYLGITNAFTLLRLLHGGDRDKDIEILSLRQQLAVVQRQLDGGRSGSSRSIGRGWPRCTRCHGRPCGVRGCWCSRRGRPRTLRSIRAKGLWAGQAQPAPSSGGVLVDLDECVQRGGIAHRRVRQIDNDAGLFLADDRVALTDLQQLLELGQRPRRPPRASG
jgi:hypothetical protein